MRRVVAKVKLSELIVNKRIVLIIAAVAVAIVCAFLIPRTNINTDMARYLPNDSQMKQGIDRMGEEFGEDGQGTGMVRVMFWSLPDSQKVAVKNELSDVDGVSSVLYQNGSKEYNHGDKVLFELLSGSQRSQVEIAREITDKYGKRVVVETSEAANTAPVGVIMIAFVLLLVVCIGTVMYMVEGGIEGSSFHDIPSSIYWAIVTTTTVGYGDITPMTSLGRFLSAFVMLLGYTVLAVPTGIVSAQMISDKKKISIRPCPHCHKTGHDEDAVFCRYCGKRLFDDESDGFDEKEIVTQEGEIK